MNMKHVNRVSTRRTLLYFLDSELFQWSCVFVEQCVNR